MIDWKRYCGFTSRTVVRRPIETIVADKERAALAAMRGGKEQPSSMADVMHSVGKVSASLETMLEAMKSDTAPTWPEEEKNIDGAKLAKEINDFVHEERAMADLLGCPVKEARLVVNRVQRGDSCEAALEAYIRKLEASGKRFGAAEMVALGRAMAEICSGHKGERPDLWDMVFGEAAGKVAKPRNLDKQEEDEKPKCEPAFIVKTSPFSIQVGGGSAKWEVLELKVGMRVRCLDPNQWFGKEGTVRGSKWDGSTLLWFAVMYDGEGEERCYFADKWLRTVFPADATLLPPRVGKRVAMRQPNAVGTIEAIEGDEIQVRIDKPVMSYSGLFLSIREDWLRTVWPLPGEGK